MYEEDNRFEGEFGLRDFLRILSKRRWIVMTLFLGIVFTTTFASFKMTPLFKAEAKILLDEEKMKVVSFQDVLVNDSIRPSTI